MDLSEIESTRLNKESTVSLESETNKMPIEINNKKTKNLHQYEGKVSCKIINKQKPNDTFSCKVSGSTGAYFYGKNCKHETVLKGIPYIFITLNSFIINHMNI